MNKDKRTMVIVTVVLPVHESSNFGNFVDIFDSHNEDVRPCSEIIHIPVERSRVAWLGLKPSLFDSKDAVARKALQCILHKHGWPIERRSYCALTENKTIGKETFLNELCYARQIRVPNSNSQLAANVLIDLWIQPPHNTRMEYYWTGLLICWENRLIRALSLTGYVSTLGGGFFLCRHFQTAIILARQQQILASVFSNDLMYYGCIINQVYSLIYSGKFSFARKLLRQVYNQISNATPKASRTLINMYQSAKLFCRRVRESNLTTLEVENGKDITRTVDNHQRIRIVMHDQSTTEDLIIPFRRLG